MQSIFEREATFENNSEVKVAQKISSRALHLGKCLCGVCRKGVGSSSIVSAISAVKESVVMHLVNYRMRLVSDARGVLLVGSCCVMLWS